MNGNGLRREEIHYAKENGVPVPADPENPYSVDQNLWDVPMSVVFWKIHGIRLQKKPLASHLLQRRLQMCQNTLKLSLVKVFPVSLNGEVLKLADLIQKLNEIAGKHGVGRIDHVEKSFGWN